MIERRPLGTGPSTATPQAKLPAGGRARLAAESAVAPVDSPGALARPVAAPGRRHLGLGATADGS